MDTTATITDRRSRLRAAALWLGLLVAAAGCDAGSTAPATEVLPPQGIPFDAVAAAETVRKGPTEGTTPRRDPPAVADAPAEPAGGKTEPSRGKSEDGGARKIGFTELASFEYEAEDPLASLTRKRPPQKYEIPESIRALTGERVEVDGYLMPTIFESGRVKRFLLTRSYITCCFGDVLNMNEVIDVTVGDGLQVSYFLSGQPVTVTGWLEVGEMKSEFGYVESIYRIVAEKVAERW